MHEAIAESKEIVEVEGWTKVCALDDISVGTGICVRVGTKQAAVFRVAADQVRSVQNLCPHSGAPVMHQALVGDSDGEPRVTCPLHKRIYSLMDGRNMSGEGGRMRRFVCRIEEDSVWVKED